MRINRKRQNADEPQRSFHLLAPSSRAGAGFRALGVDPAAPCRMMGFPVLQSTWTHPPRTEVLPQYDLPVLIGLLR